jgi:Haem-binding domain
MWSTSICGWTRRRQSFIAALALAGCAAVSIFTAPHGSSAGEPAFLSGARVDLRVRLALERSCRDCHSEATRYPWYSYVPPISWLIASDVRRGRMHLNFSRWSEYSMIRRERALSEIANQVQDREMPLALYVLIHRNARLSEADTEAIFQWTQAERTRLIMEKIVGERF